MSDKRISLDPGKQVKGASYFDDVDVEVVDAEAGARDYVQKDGTVKAEKVPCLTIKFRPLVDGGEGHEFEERYSAGDKERVGVADDGDGFVPLKEGATGLGENSRAGQFIAELVRVGYPVNTGLDEGRVKHLIGLQGHLLKVDPPKKSDKDKNKLAVITKIIRLPDGKARVGSARNDLADGLAAAFIGKALLATQGKPLTMTQLSAAANKSYAGKPEQLAVVSLLLDSKFLGKQIGWSFNGREVGPAAAEPEVQVAV